MLVRYKEIVNVDFKSYDYILYCILTNKLVVQTARLLNVKSRYIDAR